MRRILVSLTATSILVILLALSRDFWFPTQARKQWHEAWLEATETGEDPRKAIYKEHQRLLAEMEAKYQALIDREKHLNETYRKQYARVTKGKGNQ